MRRFVRSAVGGVLIVVVTTVGAQAQKPSGAGATPAAAPAGGGNSGLPSLSYPEGIWSTALATVPHGAVVLCFKMTYTNSGAQPFVLVPIGALTPVDANYPEITTDVECAKPKKQTPLIMNRLLAIVVDMREVSDSDLARIKILNINVTTQQGTPVNPEP
jgi:hypothetical protein